LLITKVKLFLLSFHFSFNKVKDDDLLNEITDEFISDMKEVKALSDENTRKIFQAVTDNINILQWLKGNLKGNEFH